jgi:hypothetical protein
VAQSLTAYSSALRNVYQDEIREQLNDLNLFRKIRKKNRDQLKIEGNGFVVVLHSSRNNGGVMSTGESGILPAAGNQGVVSITVPFRDIKGRFGITREIMKATETSKGAVTPALDYEKTRLIEDMERQSNRQFWGFGQGNLGKISSGATSTSQTLVDPGGVPGTVNGARFVQPGSIVAFQTAGVINAVKTVSAVNQSTGVITVPSVTTTTNDLVIAGATDGSNNNSAYQKELMGISGLIDSTTYVSTIFGLDRSQAANAFFRSGVSTSVGALSEDLLYRKIHDQQTISGKQVTDFFCGADLVREYIKLTQADRRYQGADLRSPDAGVAKAGMGDNNNSGLTFCGIPITYDKDAPYGSLYGIYLPNLYVAYLDEGSWDMDETGGGLRFVPNKTDYEAIYARFWNMYTDHGKSALPIRWTGSQATVSVGVVAD